MKYLNIAEGFSKVSIASDVDRPVNGDGIVTILDGLFNVRGAPEFVPMDNGTQMTSDALVD